MKRFLDILLSCLLITLLFPLLLLIAIAIRTTSPGPVLFIQKRIGFKGRVFRMFKFRTMVAGAEKMGSGLFSFEADPRVTGLGRFLRRTSLDELPQLLNVLYGSMSLVGPRPPVTYELGSWKDYTPEMRKRFNVMPGITGLAQISGRNHLSWDQKLLYDNLYVDLYAIHGSMLDIFIMVGTCWFVIKTRNTIERKTSIRPAEGCVTSLAHKFGDPSGSNVSNGNPPL